MWPLVGVVGSLACCSFVSGLCVCLLAGRRGEKEEENRNKLKLMMKYLQRSLKRDQSLMMLLTRMQEMQVLGLEDDEDGWYLEQQFLAGKT